MEDFEPLVYWAAADCDETSAFPGCTENLKKNSNGMWARGKAFGEIFLGGTDDTFDRPIFLAWKPEIWNSYCFTASSKNKTFRGILNNDVIYEFFTYTGIHKEKKVLSLMNDEKQENQNIRQAYGHIREGFLKKCELHHKKQETIKFLTSHRDSFMFKVLFAHIFILLKKRAQKEFKNNIKKSWYINIINN